MMGDHIHIRNLFLKNLKKKWHIFFETFATRSWKWILDALVPNDWDFSVI
jgi:hypothetical protein